MELYEYARPELMKGKKILYVHGFASSGQSGSVKTLQLLLPNTEIIAPDLPVEPKDAMALLRDICATDKPDLIIGISMGGMYAEQLADVDRILVNPAFHIADNILKGQGLGRKEFHSPRKDGETSFLVNKPLVEAYRECSENCFKDCRGRVYGLYGIHDPMESTFDLFASHYRNAIHFDGEHYMNDKVVLNSVLPIIQRIDDEQEGRERKMIFVSMEDVLIDMKNEGPKGKAYLDMFPVDGAVKAIKTLSQTYDIRIIASADFNVPEQWSRSLAWIEKNIGVLGWDRLIISNRKDLLVGDYLIDYHTEEGRADNFMGTLLHFGEDPFKLWMDITTFFERLAGQ